ncbi:hypothetical protein EVAR_54796_1 [Eumeta japonica]|uniref:Uncharacterized protein n=1 Tax=Eumeta variegata TaxID=151549 RepID=A0A4C1Y4B5_EUMVA|nr:hypothetical protein EVAR_54796_1 [Eumeta japonica]
MRFINFRAAAATSSRRTVRFLIADFAKTNYKREIPSDRRRVNILLNTTSRTPHRGRDMYSQMIHLPEHQTDVCLSLVSRLHATCSVYDFN